MIEYSEYKGKPMIILKRDENDKYPFSFGLTKAKMIISHLDGIKKFIMEKDPAYKHPDEGVSKNNVSEMNTLSTADSLEKAGKFKIEKQSDLNTKIRNKASSEIPKNNLPLSKQGHGVSQSESSESFLNKGVDLFDKGNLEMAFRNFSKALEENPINGDAYYYRGKIFYKWGKLKKALSELNEATKIDPNYLEAYFLSGTIQDEKNDVESAIRSFTKCIKIDTDHRESYYMRGMILFRLGKHSDAIKDYTKLIHLTPNKKYEFIPITKDRVMDNSALYFYYIRGFLYLVEHKFKESMGDYGKLITMHNKCANAYCYRGITKKEMGDIEGAIGDMKEALKLDSNHSCACVQLQELLERERIEREKIRKLGGGATNLGGNALDDGGPG